MTTRIYYRVLEHCDESIYACDVSGDLNILRERDAEFAAAVCAENYCDHHDGWDSTWPLTFSLHEHQAREECCRVKVEREMYPSYSGSMIHIDANGIEHT